MTVKPRVWLALSLCLGLAGAGIGARTVLAGETEQARAFVAQGQSALSRNDRADAVLAFERARWIAPRADFVRAAVASAGIEDAELPLPRTLRVVTSREWSALATTFGWISGLGIALVIARWHRRRALWSALAAGCASIVSMVGVMESNASSPAIVTSADAHMLVAPYPNATVERSLPAGTMVVVGSRYDAFVHVSDGDGRNGWLPRSSVERIAGSES